MSAQVNSTVTSSQVVSDCSQVVPEKVEKKITGGVEPTLMLINMVKDIRMEELRAGKVRQNDKNSIIMVDYD